MTENLVIGLDSSTTATKAIAWNAQGEAVAEGRAQLVISNPQTGWFEQDAADWWTAAVKAIRNLLDQVEAKRIAAIAIANQRESFALFDNDGHALRPATLWLDERSRAEVQILSSTLGAEVIHRISGKPADTIPCLYRCLWFKRNMPDIWARTRKIAEPHAFLTYNLTGTWMTSTASADPMGLLDMEAMDWSDTLLQAVGLSRDQVSFLRRPGQVMGRVSPGAAASCGLQEGLPVIAGGGDGQCAGTGTNVFEAGRAYVNLGTAIVSGSYGAAYRHDLAFRTMTAVAESGYIFESCLRAGTFLVNWLIERMFKADPADASVFERLEAEASQSPIGANGIAMVPYWGGCMTPYWDFNARGVIAGLTSSHNSGDVYRALLEGIALELTMVSGQIAAKTEPIREYVAIGGGAASDLWCQILADASGRTVRRSTMIEASSLGAAIAAAAGAGWYGDIKQAARAMAGRLVKTFEPEQKSHRRYGELAAIYNDLWPAITQWNSRMAAFATAAETG
ncbi:FGGY-family carbohydrate kinase [soil metagenome]